MSNPENLVFPKKEDYPAVMPEVLTETQQAFADFIMRHTIDANQQKIDCFDRREGVLAVISDPNQMIPVDKIKLSVHTSIDTDDSSAIPYHTRVARFYSEITGEIQSLYYDGRQGWVIVTPELDSYKITEQDAQPIVSTLLESELDGKLNQV